jgi:hypothetical protein
MEPVLLKIRSLNLPGNNGGIESVGLHLARALGTAAKTGPCPPVAVVVRGERAELIGLQDLGEAKLTVSYFLASLSRSRTIDGPVDAVGLMGKFQTQSGRDHSPVHLALVFLEWGDCRWWYWRALVDPADGSIIEESVTISSAEDGDPLPRTMGRWWSYGRRARMTVALRRRPESSELDPSRLVH